MLLTLVDAVRERDQRAYEQAEWSALHELLASVFIELQVMRREALLMNGLPKYKMPDMVPVRRPGEPDPNETKARTVRPGEFMLLALAGGGG